MAELIRFGVSIENELLKKFDHLIKKRSYANRSEAIRDLIRGELIQQQLEQNENTDAIGTITIIFDHHVRELNDVLTSVQHQYTDQIIAATHVHLDHHNCLEVIVVKGQANIIQNIADRLISLKGVKHGKLVLTTSGKEI